MDKNKDETMREIADYSCYNEGMKKSLLDKIFFIDKIDSKLIVDYGCADGVLISFLSKLFPDYEYIGYDIDESMVVLANKNCDGLENCFFTTDWSEVVGRINGCNATVLLSSVIHEVYAYGTRKDVDSMWSRVFDAFQYVVIRDMIPSISINKRSDINDVRKVMKRSDGGCLREFEQVFGSIEENKNLVHYLLKYRYTNNWDREVRENYFPLSREELLVSIPDAYDIEFHEHFVLPFIKSVVLRDYDILIKDNTHLKLVLKRRIAR